MFDNRCFGCNKVCKEGTFYNNGYFCKDCLGKEKNEDARNVNPSSQFYKADNGKPTIHYVPMEGIRAVARVREYGHSKYGDGADRYYECDPVRYVDAAFRHLMKIAEEGLDSVDDESNLPHLWHLATNAFFMIEIQRIQKENKENG